MGKQVAAGGYVFLTKASIASWSLENLSAAELSERKQSAA